MSLHIHNRQRNAVGEVTSKDGGIFKGFYCHLIFNGGLLEFGTGDCELLWHGEVDVREFPAYRPWMKGANGESIGHDVSWRCTGRLLEDHSPSIMAFKSYDHIRIVCCWDCECGGLNEGVMLRDVEPI